MHCCCCVIYDDAEGMDGNFIETIEHHSGFGFDYATTVEDEEKSVKRYKGLILKNGIENDYMYENDGVKFAYKAKVEDVDWKKTFESGDICSFTNYSMFVDEFVFYNNKTQKINYNEFHKLVKRLLNRSEMVQIADIHV